jgi:flagellar biosynthesis/type III secretory pathway M-ring protein FliF/YscJ
MSPLASVTISFDFSSNAKTQNLYLFRVQPNDDRHSAMTMQAYRSVQMNKRS